MKNLVILTLLVASLSVVSSCEGPPGPAGRDGLDGLNGEEGFVFDYEFSFTAPEYSVLLNLPETFTMLESDVMLVYLLWEVLEDGTEVWRHLPQTLFLNEGTLHYNYDFTLFDATVFMDGTVDLNSLGATETDNWIARIVVVPAQFGGRLDLDYDDYEAVKSFYGLKESKLVPENYQKRYE